MRRWRSEAAGWLGRLRDLVYPGICHLCGEPVAGGGCLCDPCGEALPGLGERSCECCGEGFEGRIEAAFSCPNCRDQRFAFDFARPALRRSEGAMTLVHDLKYGRRLELGRELARLTMRSFEDRRLAGPLAEAWPLVPVPLFRRRQRWRQFNQAQEIAGPLGRLCGLPVRPVLRRIRATETQTRLTRAERLKNLRGAFALARGFESVRGVILVDDVFTTGSTVNECSRVLRKAGVQNVVVVTAMRG